MAVVPRFAILLAVLYLRDFPVAGIDDSIEAGKDANIVVSAGDILDMKSSIITHAFIQGRSIELVDKHKQMFERYKYKYGIK